MKIKEKYMLNIFTHMNSISQAKIKRVKKVKITNCDYKKPKRRNRHAPKCKCK